jgi:hypothetical protein
MRNLFAFLGLLLPAMASLSFAPGPIGHQPLPASPIQWSQFSEDNRPQTLADHQLKGNVSQTITREYDGEIVAQGAKPRSVTTCKFDAVGFLAEREADAFSREEYFFGQGAKFLAKRKCRLAPTKSCTDSLSISYDAQGRPSLIRQYVFRQRWEVIFNTSFTYDARDWLIEEMVCGRKGDTLTRIHYQYDERGRKVEETYVESGDGYIETKRMWYNEKNQVVKESIKIPEEGTGITIYSYNDHGLLSAVDQSYEGVDGGTLGATNYSYKYDAAGNWVERKSIRFGNETSIEVRKIQYR